jgi:hypothetical protein
MLSDITVFSMAIRLRTVGGDQAGQARVGEDEIAFLDDRAALGTKWLPTQ